MRFQQKILFFVFLSSLFGVVGCATDNEFLAQLPLFEAYSDKIPGLTPSYDRTKLIRLKGEKGKNAPDREKEIIVAQLMVEYRTSPDPNMRREAVDAMAKISYPKRDQYMKEILEDTDPFVRISALEAIGNSFANEQERAKIYANHLKSDPDKDVRLTSSRLLGKVGKVSKFTQKGRDAATQEIIVGALGDSLNDKVTAIRYQGMISLHEATGKDYGNNIDRWVQYVASTKKPGMEIPKERTLAERIPAIQLPMLK